MDVTDESWKAGVTAARDWAHSHGQQQPDDRMGDRETEMTKTEKIQDLVGQLFTDGRKDAIQDIVTDLKDTLKGAPADYRKGLQAAIDLIESNY